MTSYTVKMALRDRFLAALTSAQEQRPWRQEMEGDELGWIVYERTTMHQLVNQVRAESDLPPVDLGRVTRAENLAAGHVDYSQKFALYCAELALATP